MTIPAAPDDPEIAIGGDDTSPSAPLLQPVTASIMPDRPSLSDIPVATASIATPTPTAASVEAARVPSFVTIALANGTGNIERTTNPNDGSLSVKVTTINSQPNGYREILIEYFHIPTDMTSTVSMLIDEGTPPLSVYRTNMERQILPPSSAEVVTSPPQPAYAISPTTATTTNNNTINDAGFPQRQPSTELTTNEKTARKMCLVIAVVIFVAIIVFAVATEPGNNYDNNWPTPSPVPAPPAYPVSACNGKRTGGTPNWKDSAGDSCEWYERSSEYSDRCSGYDYGGAMGPAKDHCCYCLVTAAPTPRPTYYWQKRTPYPVSSCNGAKTGGMAGWKDINGSGCDWYEVNDSPGCPRFGDISGIGGTAKDNCCFCRSSSTSDPDPPSTSPFPVSSCNGEKTGGTPEWKDRHGFGCDYYEKLPWYCKDVYHPNGNGMGSPMDHCCACMIVESDPPSASPVQSTPTVVPTLKPNQESILLE